MKLVRTWPENAQPTAEQLAAWLLVCTDTERLTHAAAAIHSGEVAERCFQQNHDALMDEQGYRRTPSLRESVGKGLTGVRTPE